MRNNRSGAWFTIPGVQTGDRTIAQQLKGLQPLLDEVRGKSVLDLGCAEGMITRACVDAGAARVTGLDNNGDFIAAAMGNARFGISFAMADMNLPPQAAGLDEDAIRADVVLMLGVLHKLRLPLLSLQYWAPLAAGLLVIRLPASMPGFVLSPRSGNVRHDVTACLSDLGFSLDRVEKGHEDEWVGYFCRG